MAGAIPGFTIAMAVVLMLPVHDVIPSPPIVSDEPKIAYGIFLAFFVASFMMLALGFPIVPLVLGVVLCRIAEPCLSQVIARADDITVFLMPGSVRPVVAGLMVLAGLVLAGLQLKRGAIPQQSE